MNKYSQTAGEVIQSLKPKQMKMRWMTEDNNVDCGVFTMLHMEKYMGQAEGKWDCELPLESDVQKLLMWKLRTRFASKILSHQMNSLANKMLKNANTFMNKHTRDEIKKIVLRARSTREDRINEFGAAN